MKCEKCSTAVVSENCYVCILFTAVDYLRDLFPDIHCSTKAYRFQIFRGLRIDCTPEKKSATITKRHALGHEQFSKLLTNTFRLIISKLSTLNYVIAVERSSVKKV